MSTSSDEPIDPLTMQPDAKKPLLKQQEPNTLPMSHTNNHNNNHNNNGINNDHNHHTITNINDLENMNDISDLDYDSLLSLISFGRYQYSIVLLSALSNCSDAIEIVAISFVLTKAKDDLNMSSTDEGLLTAIIFVGMMLGGWIWGSMADQSKYGRIKVLQYSLLINAIFGILSSIAPNFIILLIIRFISGIGVGGSIPVTFSYASEFFDPLNRGKYLAIIAVSWPVGAIFTSVLAYIFVEDKSGIFDFYIFNLHVESWRVFLLPCAIPALTASILFGYVADNSPKFLIFNKKDYGHASKLLIKMAKKNETYDEIVEKTRNLGNNNNSRENSMMSNNNTNENSTIVFDPETLRRFDILSINDKYEESQALIIPQPHETISPLMRQMNSGNGTNNNSNNNNNNQSMTGISNHNNMDEDETSISQSNTSNNSHGKQNNNYNTNNKQPTILVSSSPEMDELSKLKQDSPILQGSHAHHSTKTRNVCSNLCHNLKKVLSKTMILFTDKDLRSSHILACIVWFTLSYGFYGLAEWLPTYFDSIGTVNTYISTIFTNISSLPGCIFTAYLIEAKGNSFWEWFDRRKVLAISMFGSAVSLIGLLFLENGNDIVALLCVYSGIVVAAWTALDVISTELSPTFVRSTAYGVFAAFGRIGAIAGNLTFGIFGNNDFAGPLTICGISLCIGTVACLFLPNMKGKSLQ